MGDFRNEYMWAGDLPEATPEDGPWELLVVDQTPFLKKALAQCKRLRTELNKKQKLLREFEEGDRAAFQLWMSRTYGAKISRIRELHEELEAYKFILYNLSHCEFHNPDKMEEVHQELLRRKAEGTLYEFVPPDHAESGIAEEREQDWDEVRSGIEGLFEEMFGEADEATRERGREDFRRAGFGFGEPQASARKTEKDPELKACYRLMAKRLHPDYSTLEETVREKRWHEMQAAYENNDLEALRRVEAVCDMDEAGLSIKLGLARLRELAEYHRSHLQPIRQALKQAKEDPAFEFRKRGPEPIAWQVEGEIEETLSDLREHLHYMRQTVGDVGEDPFADVAAGFYDEADDAFDDVFFNAEPEPARSAPRRARTGTGPEQMDLF